MSTLELFTTDWREVWQGARSQEPVGAIFTRPEIVDLILDLAGYSPATIRLAELMVLEPSCGDGAFLETIVARLLESERIHKGSIDWAAPELDSALRAADISLPSLVSARGLIRSRLIGAACPRSERKSSLPNGQSILISCSTTGVSPSPSSWETRPTSAWRICQRPCWSTTGGRFRPPRIAPICTSRSFNGVCSYWPRTECWHSSVRIGLRKISTGRRCAG